MTKEEMEELYYLLILAKMKQNAEKLEVSTAGELQDD